MPKFVKLPVEIEALKFTGDNLKEIQDFVGLIPDYDNETLGFRLAKSIATVHEEEGIVARVWDKLHSTWVGVKAGQWIMKGVKGEFYPCDDEVFVQTYVEKDFWDDHHKEGSFQEEQLSKLMADHIEYNHT